MSARANPYDNAWTECFREDALELPPDAKLELFEYIGYYNNQRKHSAIGYLTPNRFEAQHINLN